MWGEIAFEKPLHAAKRKIIEQQTSETITMAAHGQRRRQWPVDALPNCTWNGVGNS